MKRIYFKEYVKLSTITKKSKYRIIVKSDIKFIIDDSGNIFKICGYYKTQFNQLLIVKGNAINFLNYLLTRNKTIRFLIEVDVEKYLCNNLLSVKGFEKEAFDEFEEAFDDFLDLTDKINKYNSDYPTISGEKYVL